VQIYLPVNLRLEKLSSMSDLAGRRQLRIELTERRTFQAQWGSFRTPGPFRTNVRTGLT
jgi:hypothetical protein